ncbi:MAG: glycosyltransferase family 87 protein [Thermoflexales bacterium]
MTIRDTPRPGVGGGWRLGFLALVVVVHAGIVASILLQDRPIIWPLHNDTIHRVGKGADFYAAYHAGMNLNLGRRVYADLPDGVTPYWYPFRYLPVVAVIFQPLTRLPPAAAWAAWVMAVELLLIVFVIALWRRLADLNARLAVTALLLLNSPYFLELYMGQFTFAAAVLCYLALWLPAGAVLYSASVLLKPFTLATAPALMRRRAYWPHVALAIVLLLLTSAPYFINYPNQWTFFFETNFRLTGGLHAGNYGLLRLVKLVVDELGDKASGPLWEALTGLFRVGLLGGTAALVWLARRESLWAGVAALMLAHFVTYQHVWEHHLSAVSVIGATLLLLPDASGRFKLLVLASLALLALPTPFGIFDVARDPAVFDPSLDWPMWQSFLVAAPKVFPVLALYTAALLCLLRSGLRSPAAALLQRASVLRRAGQGSANPQPRESS